MSTSYGTPQIVTTGIVGLFDPSMTYTAPPSGYPANALPPRYPGNYDIWFRTNDFTEGNTAYIRTASSNVALNTMGGASINTWSNSTARANVFDNSNGIAVTIWFNLKDLHSSSADYGGSNNNWRCLMGGVILGSPSGSLKGTGTLNATAVYDDNTLLTDYVFDRWQTGMLDPSDMDNHRALAFDPNLLNIDTFSQMCASNRSLPTMIPRAEWNEDTRFSLGELSQRLWETVEIQAVHIAKLNDRLKALELALMNK